MSDLARAVTPATRLLDRLGVAYRRHVYDYRDRGGAGHAARCLGWPEAHVVKTLVMQSDDGRTVLVLMHGDRQVSPGKLAAAMGARRVAACSPRAAHARTGYVVGGISPFGIRRALPVFVEASIFDLDAVLVNGGRRGLLLELPPQTFETALPGARRVSVAAGC